MPLLTRLGRRWREFVRHGIAPRGIVWRRHEDMVSPCSDVYRDGRLYLQPVRVVQYHSLTVLEWWLSILLQIFDQPYRCARQRIEINMDTFHLHGVLPGRNRWG